MDEVSIFLGLVRVDVVEQLIDGALRQLFIDDGSEVADLLRYPLLGVVLQNGAVPELEVLFGVMRLCDVVLPGYLLLLRVLDGVGGNFLKFDGVLLCGIKIFRKGKEQPDVRRF